MKKFFMLSLVAATAMILTTGAICRAESAAEKAGSSKAAPAKNAGDKKGKAATASPAIDDPKVKYWTWKREIKGVQLGNLAAPWNGANFFFTITAPESMKTNKAEGDIIVATGADTRILGEIGGDFSVKSLWADGPGDQLLIETKDGKFLSWPDWKKGGEQKGTAVAYPAGTVPSETFKTAVFVDKGKKEATIYGHDGKKLRSYPLSSVPDDVPAVWPPFFKDEEFVLVISANGEVTYYNREQKLWSVTLDAPVKAVASSYMQSEMLAFGTKDGIVLVNGKDGTLKGRVSLKNDGIQLACSQDGVFCAAIGSGAGEDARLVAFSADGKELWSKKLNAKPRRSFLKLQALAKGSQVIAGVEEKGQPEIQAFDEKGEIIWRAPMGTGLLDYRVSWGGDAVAALYKDVVTYYNFKPMEKKTVAPMHPVPQKKPAEKAKAHKKSGDKKEANPETKSETKPEPKKD